MCFFPVLSLTSSPKMYMYALEKWSLGHEESIYIADDIEEWLSRRGEHGESYSYRLLRIILLRLWHKFPGILNNHITANIIAKYFEQSDRIRLRREERRRVKTKADFMAKEGEINTHEEFWRN